MSASISPKPSRQTALPVVIEIHVQKGGFDCGIAALATFTGQPYRVVSEAALKVCPNSHKSGMWATDVIKVAKVLGVKLVRAPLLDPRDTDATGLVVLRKPNGIGHVATLFQGVLADPSSGLAYDFTTYLTTKRYSVRVFLTLPATGKCA
jgi:hypothetical protein